MHIRYYFMAGFFSTTFIKQVTKESLIMLLLSKTGLPLVHAIQFFLEHSGHAYE